VVKHLVSAESRNYTDVVDEDERYRHSRGAASRQSMYFEDVVNKLKYN